MIFCAVLSSVFSAGKCAERFPERQSALRWGEQRGVAGESAILSAAAQQIFGGVSFQIGRKRAAQSKEGYAKMFLAGQMERRENFREVFAKIFLNG